MAGPLRWYSSGSELKVRIDAGTKATLAIRAGAAAAGLAAAVAAGLTGCAARAVPAPPIQIGTSYVPVPQSAGTTVAYVGDPQQRCRRPAGVRPHQRGRAGRFPRPAGPG